MNHEDNLVEFEAIKMKLQELASENQKLNQKLQDLQDNRRDDICVKAEFNQSTSTLDTKTRSVPWEDHRLLKQRLMRLRNATVPKIEYDALAERLRLAESSLVSQLSL